MTSSPAAVEDAYFASNPPPKALAQHTALASAFLASHAQHPQRRVVLITSGGTTVPLERQTVRFIDNFSAGTRGATSAEYFLEAGYAVIFLHRQFSLLPYSRHFSHSRHCFLDFLTEGPDGAVRWRDDDNDDDDDARLVRGVLRKYRAAKDADMLLMIPFVTIGDYLHELRALSTLMRPLGPRGLLYLAAAVSDFFVPPERMSEHKIQSTSADAADLDSDKNRDGASPRRLVIDLDPVPKFLKNLVDGWAPRGMIVSYKLETDPAILLRKARHSLDRYQHHLVIGNLLATRKWEVVFVSPRRPDRWLRVGPAAHASPTPLRPEDLPRGDPDTEIEKLIIPAVAELHDEHISGGP
ncbi:hypothetical protein E4U42_000581 [Claviceps africana]|uniref:Phosphopantothenate-cysteine ligase n=1 Tax=Claviceps africana TaxID=83212 RepID=A0A8K0NE77_9HYPO|nr:hypothetical protein E4U42_000581 [Claviceps africana]